NGCECERSIRLSVESRVCPIATRPRHLETEYDASSCAGEPTCLTRSSWCPRLKTSAPPLHAPSACSTSDALTDGSGRKQNRSVSPSPVQSDPSGIGTI